MLMTTAVVTSSCSADDPVGGQPPGNIDPELHWQKSLGGSGADEFPIVQQSMNGGFILAGASTSNDGDVSFNHSTDYSDIWIVKMDESGSIVWEKSFGGSIHESPQALLQLDDGGYLIGGVTNSFDGDVSWNFGSIDWWMIRLNPAGDMVWQKNMGGSFHESPGAMLQVGDGFIIAGSTASSDGDVNNKNDNNSRDLWLVQTNSAGDIIWENTYGNESKNEGGKAIYPTADGGFLVAAEASGDIWLVKFDSEMAIAWDKFLGGSAADDLSSMMPTADGGFIISATSESADGDVSENFGESDMWLVRINADGDILWEHSYGGSETETDPYVIESNDGGFWAVCASSSDDGQLSANHGGLDYWVLKLDANGDIDWDQNYGGSQFERVYSVTPSGGGVLVGGHTSSSDGDVQTNQGSDDIWLITIE